MEKINKNLSVWLKSGATVDIKELGYGEFGYGTTAKSLKVGDDKTKFNKLPGLGGINKFKDIQNMYNFFYTDGYDRTVIFYKPDHTCSLCGLFIDDNYYSLSEILSVGKIHFYDTHHIASVKCYPDYVEMIWGGSVGCESVVIPVYERNISADLTEYQPDTDTDYGYGYSYHY